MSSTVDALLFTWSGLPRVRHTSSMDNAWWDGLLLYGRPPHTTRSYVQRPNSKECTGRRGRVRKFGQLEPTYCRLGLSLRYMFMRTCCASQHGHGVCRFKSGLRHATANALLLNFYSSFYLGRLRKSAALTFHRWRLVFSRLIRLSCSAKLRANISASIGSTSSARMTACNHRVRGRWRSSLNCCNVLASWQNHVAGEPVGDGSANGCLNPSARRWPTSHIAGNAGKPLAQSC